MELGKYKRALKASTRPKHLRRVVYQPEIGDTDVDFPSADQPFNRFAGGGLVRKLFAKLKRELPVGNDTETLMQAKALTKAVEGKPMNDAEIDMLMRSSIMDDTMQRMVDDMDMSETEAYDTLVKTMQIGKPQNREGFLQGGKVRRNRPKPALDRLSDALLNAYAEDDIRHLIMNSGVGNFSELDRANLSTILLKDENAMQYVSKNSGLSTEDILDLIDDRDAYSELELASEAMTRSAATRMADERKFYQDAEQWIMKNAKRYDDPAKFKKAFKRTFPKNNYLLNAINSKKTTPIMTQFSDGFKREIFGMGEGRSPGGKVVPGKATKDISRIGTAPSVLDDVFRIAIYNFNPTIRNKIRNEFMSIIPKGASVSDKQALSIKTNLEKSKLLKQFGLDKKIKGPISRLILKDLGENLFNSISEFRKPFQTVESTLVHLKDKVNLKYREAFKETLQAVRYAKKSLWNDAKQQLNLAQNINFDHKIPKALIDAGYADEINYIKLTPVSGDFNTKVKNIEFDRPLIKLVKKYELASPNEKRKIFNEIQSLKDSFNKKTRGYLEDVTVGEKKGKLTFESKAKPLTKQTDVISELKNNLSKVDAQTATNAIANLACPGQYADGGRVKFSRGSECYAKGLQLLDDAKFGDEKAKAKVAKGMKALKVLGGIGTEILFETAFLLPSIAEGKPLDVLIGESSLGYLGLGTSEDEKTIEMSGYDPRVIRYVGAKRAYEDNKELDLKQKQMVPGLDDDFYQNMEDRKQANRSVYEKFVRSNDRDIAAAANKLAEQRKQKSYDENKKGLPARTAQAILEQLNKTFIGASEPGEVFDLAVFQDGGRVGFEDGGFTRRGFLKALGALAAVIAGLRTGKGTKVVPKTTTAKQVVENAGKGTPEWFAPLVDKIKTEGIDVPAENVARTSGRESVTKLEVKNPESNTTDSYYLFENPDTGEVRIDVDALGVGANDGEFSLYMRPRRVEGLTDEGIQQIDEGEFFVTEDRAVGRMSGPDDYDIDLEALDTDLSGSASNWHQLEEFATGKTDKAAQTEQLKKKDFIERNPGDDIENRYGVYDPPEPDDYD